ncbi:hypothetical protein NX059_010771 [Plenodomus lindquistii]|nr:hypothetical protein NX059_010771 [Plenodomus lindquistii]
MSGAGDPAGAMNAGVGGSNGSGSGSGSGEGSGVRRRHSASYDDDGVAATSEETDNATSTPTSTPTSTSTQPYAIPREQHGDANSRARTSAVEDTARPSVSSDAARQVRFSADAQRQISVGKSSSGKARPGTPDLSVETREVGAGGNTSHAPMNRSPLSPSTRSRGYSLRSALFRKNVASTPDANIELEEGVGSSRGRMGYIDESREQHSTSKGGDAVVTVTHTPEYEAYISSASDLSKTKLSKGPIALPPRPSDWHTKGRSRKARYVKQVKELAEQARKFVFRIKDVPPSKDGRHIPLDAYRSAPLTDERTEQPYTSNWIRSTRYSAWNFVPRQLVAQFSKLANFYFLVISILQMIPGLSTTGQFTTIVPLLFFVTLSIAKEGYDDLRRYRLDKAENNREARVLRASPLTVEKRASTDGASTPSPSPEALHWEPIKWQDINVGDIIKLDRDDAAPADLALLHTTGENSVAYVETMALDGETNLKSKQTPALVSKTILDAQDVLRTTAEFVIEDPNRDLYSFEGRVAVGDKQAPLTLNEIVFRGSILRNTPDAIGMVIYSGEECRIRMNANKNPRIKAPALQGLVNRIVILIVVFVLLLSIFNAVAYKIWQRKEDDMFYLSDASVAFFPSFTSFIIMFNTMIPLSLYVSLEIVKLAQMFFLHADVDMYDPVSDTPCEPRTSTINEELGQVSYVFSDKTGTLTDNEMKFRKMSVGGVAWLHDKDLRDEKRKKEEAEGRAKEKKKRKKGKGPAKMKKSGKEDKGVGAGETVSDEDAGPQWKSNARPGKTSRELRTQDMLKYMQRKPHTPFSKKGRMFLLSLALCHTCLPELQEDGATHFMASSPDELALVQAAQDMGFLLINRDVHTITLKIPSTNPSSSSSSAPLLTETYEILDVIEFSSKRKRMSIIVRFPDGRICIICKGADSIVLQRLRLATLANKKMVEIERRANARKSLDAQRVIARMSLSERDERRSSVVAPGGGRRSMTLAQAARKSLSMGRPSFARSSIGGRASAGGVRDDMDAWLRERESDGLDVESVDANTESAVQTPRPSGLERFSMAYTASARSSMQIEEVESLVDEGVAGDEPATLEKCLQHINDFATEGLRTLLYGHKFLHETEYQAWKQQYLAATTSLVDRTRLIEEAGDMIEKDLELCAATAIEDKLQKGVPEAIDKLRRAGIKMWMLTGDKRETAINIGYSCRLIKEYSTVTVLDHEAATPLDHAISSAIANLTTGSIAHAVVVVDGQTLSKITSNESLEANFHSLAVVADSVICCRASPSQKALLVKSIRKRVRKSITLAIGDGANDIAMIQEAHVGIGITGKEGLQAARTSDYSIAQFRFLTVLLLVHGRWNYIRTCKYTVGTFWKELLFYLTQALYQRSVGYTGTSLYESWGLSMFNTLFTSLPVIFMGVFEKDLQKSTLLAVPELYRIGQINGGFNVKVYVWWMFMASAEAMVVYFVMLGLYGQAVWSADDSIFPLGTITYTVCVVLIAGKMQFIETHTLTLTNALALFLSIGGWLLWTIILSSTYNPSSKIYYVRSTFLHRFGNTLHWWSVVLLIIAAVFVFEIAVRALKVAFWGSDEDFFRMAERDEGCRRRFEEASKGEMVGREGDGGVVGEGKGGEEERREREVGDLLRRRGDGGVDGEAEGGEEDGGAVDRMLSRGFGDVKTQ